MANEKQTYEVELDYTSKGASQKIQELDKMIDKTDDLTRSGVFTVKEQERMSKAFYQSGRAAHAGAVDYAGMNKALAEMGLTAVKAEQGTSQATGSIISMRYALYDVSSTLLQTSAALTGLVVGTGAVAIGMDRQFADVIRTTESTGQSAQRLRKDFEELFTSMPVSWGALTEIGTLAGQLNIASGDVAEFTKLVAQFAATTDVSVEQSATAFGRLAQLLKVPASEYENLGSSILAVGVNSVATESQIINISSQIASMGNLVGMSADEVFGLSAALASLGTQPELSRGVITRLFSNIQTSIASGSDRLEAFGRLAGTTGAEFAKAWGDDASGALQSLMDGLGRVESSQAVGVLRELGITAARDVPTILRLAQNSDVLAESLAVAAQGYAEGTALGDQYSIISTTVAEKLNILINNFQQLISTVGQSAGAIGGLVDVAIGFVKVLDAIADNPITATVFGVAGALAALAIPLLLVTGLAVRGAAGVLALKTAMVEASVASGAFATRNAATSASLGALTLSAGQATLGVRGFGIAAKTALIGTGIGIALVALGAAWELVSNTINKASDAQAEFRDSMGGLGEAMATDTRAGGVAFATFAREISGLSAEQKNTQNAAENLTAVMGGLADATNSSADAARNSTLAFGETAREFVKSQLAVSEELSKLSQGDVFTDYWVAIGADMDELIEIAATKGETGIQAYIKRLEDAYELSVGSSGLVEGDPLFEFLVDAQAVDQFDQMLIKLGELRPAAQEAANANVILGGALLDTGDAALGASGSITDLINELFEIENAAINSESAIFRLGSSMFDGGDAFDYFSEAGRANLGNLMSVMEALAAESGGDASVTAANYQALFEFIQREAPNAAGALNLIRNGISSLGVTGVKSSGRDFQSFFGGWDKSAQAAARSSQSAGRAGAAAAKAVKEEVRTLLDYAGDLAKVWDRAFDIRFSGQSTLDTITSSFISIREAADAAAKRIRDLNNDISGLSSDIDIQEYFLSIAVEYGDTKRAAAIEADLAKKRAELADKTADLQKEQDSASKSLVGNSKGAIENRKQITDLVKQYQSHIGALAASGMSSDELARKTAQLKADFIAQATQLGYNTQEVMHYAAAFDDVAVAINQIPRNITVAANVNPAIQALNEFQASANKSINDVRSNAAKGISVPFNASNSGFAQALINQRAGLQAKVNSFPQGMSKSKAYTDALAELMALNAQIRAMGYAEGGYTGAGAKYAPAGIVHRGEYVIPKRDVNQSTGLPNIDALGRLMGGVSVPMRGRANGSPTSSGLTPSVALTAGTIQAIAQAVQPHLFLDGQKVAQASSQAYAYSTEIGAN